MNFSFALARPRIDNRTLQTSHVIMAADFERDSLNRLERTVSPSSSFTAHCTPELRLYAPTSCWDDRCELPAPKHHYRPFRCVLISRGLRFRHFRGVQAMELRRTATAQSGSKATLRTIPDTRKASVKMKKALYSHRQRPLL